MNLNRRSFLTTLAAAGIGAALSPVPVLAASHAGDPHRRVGYVMSSEQFTVDHLVRFGEAAERAGFHAAWSSDHFQPWQPNEGHSSLAWATLAAVSQRTSRLTLGTGVTCPTYRYNPAIVAEAFSTLGQLAPGRVFLGVGTGEALNEAAAGGGWADYAERAERLVEAISVIRKLWTGQEVTFQGKYYRLDKARLYDIPKHPVPIYVAGNGPKSARLAGLHGDGWVTDYKNLTNPKLKQAFEEGARASGRDPAKLMIVLESWAVAGSTEEARKGAEKWRFTKKAWHKGYVTNPDEADIQHRADTEIALEEVYKDWAVGTDPAVHLAALDKMFRAGAKLVFVHSPQPDQLAFIDFYSRRVLPHVAG